MRSAGIDPRVDPAAIDESPRAGEEPVEYAARLAREKALAVAGRHPDATVLGADTVVVIDRAPLGKPVDEREARTMLHRLAGRKHEVVTAVYWVPPGTATGVALSVLTEVYFRELTEREIEGYLASREWQDKAGGYAIQGHAASFVRAISGSYTNVVGLPLCEVVCELRRAGVIE